MNVRVSRSLRACAIACTLALASGCFTFRAQLPGALREPAPREDIVIVGHFDHSITQTYVLWGLVNAPPNDLFKPAMKKAVEDAGADGMTNIIVDTRFGGTDLALQIVTLGIVAPRTYRIRGDLVRLSAPPLPGKPLVKRAPPLQESAPPPVDPPPSPGAPAPSGRAPAAGPAQRLDPSNEPPPPLDPLPPRAP